MPAKAVSSGGASLSNPSLARGTHAICAVYQGDSLHHGSQSVTITQTIS